MQAVKHVTILVLVAICVSISIVAELFSFDLLDD